MKHQGQLEQRQKRLSKAKANFQKIQEKIKPFIKYQKLVKYSTVGKWVDGTNPYLILPVKK